MKITQSFCHPLEDLNFLKRYPESKFRRERWYSPTGTVVLRCQQTCTELLVRCCAELFWGDWVTASKCRSSPSSDPLIDLRLVNLGMAKSSPTPTRSRAILKKNLKIRVGSFWFRATQKRINWETDSLLESEKASYLLRRFLTTASFSCKYFLSGAKLKWVNANFG